MFNTNELLDKLNSMSSNDLAKIVEEALSKSNEGWVECKNCIYFQDGECWLIEMQDGCYHGKPIDETESC